MHNHLKTNCLKSDHTGQMPWDDLFDLSYYKVSRPRLIKKRYLVVDRNLYISNLEVTDVNTLRTSDGWCVFDFKRG
jgi:hypothetical protein